MTALKERVREPHRHILQNVYEALNQVFDQAKYFFLYGLIHVMELDPFKVILGGALVEGWGTTSQREEA